MIITAKHPAGRLRVDLGTWDDGVSLQKNFDLEEATDFEDIIVDLDDWPADCFSNIHVLWQSGKLPGLSVLKKIQIILNANSNYDTWTIAGDKNLLGSDWDVADKKNNMSSYNGISYTLTKSTYLSKGTYQFKVYKDNAMQKSYPKKNATLVINEEAFYIVKFTFNSDTKELSATATKKEVLFYNFISKGKVAEVKSIASDFKGDLIIPSSVVHDGEKYTVTKILDNAFANCKGLYSVIIPNSVTSIGQSAFSRCRGLTSVTIGNSVTSIGDDAFYECSSLTSVTIPNSITSIGVRSFLGCSSLTSINIPNSVTAIGSSAFWECSSLTSVDIPKSLTSIGQSVFFNCKGLTTVTIPNSVTTIGRNAFSGCTGLTSINIPSSVTSLSGFSGCTGLTSITIPSSVTDIERDAFQGCTGLTSVTIPNSVIWINGCAFQGCSKLKSVTIGSGVNTIRDQTFADCPELTDVYCYAENVPSTNVDAFEGSYIEYATLHVPKGCLGTYKDVKPWKNFKSIVEIVDAKVKLSKTEATIEKGKTLKLKATITPSDLADKSVTWKSSNKKVATVSSSGKVKGVKAGTATITCTSNATGLKATCKVTVVNGLVTLNKTEAYVQKGKTMTLKATVTPETLTDKSVTWESSDKKIATVTKAGKVKGVKYGTATITCTSVATGVKATCQVTVGKVVIGTSEVTIKKSRETILIPFLYPEDLADKSVTWKSSDTSRRQGERYQGWYCYNYLYISCHWSEGHLHSDGIIKLGGTFYERRG